LDGKNWEFRLGKRQDLSSEIMHIFNKKVQRVV
jgi:hypothetical protein